MPKTSILGSAEYRRARTQSSIGQMHQSGSARAARLRFIRQISEETKIPIPKLRQRYNALVQMGFNPVKEPTSLIFPDSVIATLKKARKDERIRIYKKEIAHLNQRR